MNTGAVGRNRTGDLLITNQLLYQLSYNSEVADYIGQSASRQSGRWFNVMPSRQSCLSSVKTARLSPDAMLAKEVLLLIKVSIPGLFLTDSDCSRT